MGSKFHKIAKRLSDYEETKRIINVNMRPDPTNEVVVLGICYKLLEIIDNCGVRIRCRIYHLKGMCGDDFNAVFGFNAMDIFKDYISYEGTDVVIDAYFMADGVSASEKRDKNRERQRRHREKYKGVTKAKAAPVKTTKVQTDQLELVGDEVEDQKDEHKPFYMTSAGKKLTDIELIWWKAFWKNWIRYGSYGEKATAAERFRQHCAKRIITDKNIVIVCEAAEYESAHRKEMIAAQRTPKWPQGWLTGRRWETYQEQKEAGEIKKILPPKAQSKKAKHKLPNNWHAVLGRAVYKNYTNLIKDYDAGTYADINNLSPEIIHIIQKEIKSGS